MKESSLYDSIYIVETQTKLNYVVKGGIIRPMG